MVQFTQEHYNTIIKVLQNGAPALANELIQALNYLVNENTRLSNELHKLSTTEEKEEN